VKSESEKLSEIRDIREKLETLCSRVDSLENLSSRYNNNNNGELQVDTTEQLNDVGNRQEPHVHLILFKCLFVLKKTFIKYFRIAKQQNQLQNTKFIISNYFKVPTKKEKWSRIKAKTVDYFKAISIPGVPQIVKTESYPIKLLWTLVILAVFGFGFDNISQAVADYYKYDKITNIERVYPENFTFPAIIICNRQEYMREHYKNRSLINTDKVFTNLNLKQFLDFKRTGFDLFKNNSFLSVNNHLDTFKAHHPQTNLVYDCLRFNAVTNKSVEIFKESSVLDRFRISINNFYVENISYNEYYKYTLPSDSFFYVFVCDNSLNSLENLQYLVLDPGSKYFIDIEKVSIETKLPEPYNPCKKSSVDEPFHRMNCIEACIYKEIKNKYNCTFPFTLFSIQSFRECVRYYMVLKDEFSASCLSECPMESCFTERFNFDSTATFSDPDSTLFRFKFRDLSSINITQIPKTDSFTFLNNIGGGLGLFMGIAFPNLIEFSQFILEIVLIFFIKKIN